MPTADNTSASAAKTASSVVRRRAGSRIGLDLLERADVGDQLIAVDLADRTLDRSRQRAGVDRAPHDDVHERGKAPIDRHMDARERCPVERRRGFVGDHPDDFPRHRPRSRRSRWVAPMPSARVSSPTIVKPGLRVRLGAASDRSWVNSASIAGDTARALSRLCDGRMRDYLRR